MRIQEDYEHRLSGIRCFPAVVVSLALASGWNAAAQPADLPGFWKSRLADVDAAVKEVKKGHAIVLAKSAGGRDIYLVTYGDRQRRGSSAN